MPLKVTPVERGESVDFQTADGLRLSGSYLQARTDEQAGVIVYCHEYLSDRWSFCPYIDHLRDLGYDIFTFDFRNHGASDLDRDYAPLQWTTEHEIDDLRAALAYLRTRDDHDPAGFGLFGVSRGGTTALITAAAEPDVWGVVTDGAFPTQGTMVAYIVRWAEIYVPSAFLRSLIPMWLYGFLARTARLCTERSLRCRFPSVEAAVSRLTPRPWLMIHGQRDTYIGPEIAQTLFDRGEDPKELWLVPDRQAQPLPRNRSRGLRSATPGLSGTIRSSPSAERNARGYLVGAPGDLERLRPPTGAGSLARGGGSHPGLTK